MNSTPKTAAAPMNTALFHIGKMPSRTPEKMKPVNILRKRSAGTTGSSSGSVATDTTAGITGSGSEGLSVGATSLEGVSATISEEGFVCAAIGSGEGEVMSLFGSEMVSDRVRFSEPVSAVISGDRFGGTGGGGGLGRFFGRMR